MTLDIYLFKRITRDGTVLATTTFRREGTSRVAQVVDGKHQWVERPGVRLVFSGAATGEHSLDLDCSDEARVRAHWEGYLLANQIRRAPEVGELVDFPSASSRSGWRTGRVVKVGPRRVTVEFKYKKGGTNTATVPHGYCRFAA